MEDEGLCGPLMLLLEDVKLEDVKLDEEAGLLELELELEPLI